MNTMKAPNSEALVSIFVHLLVAVALIFLAVAFLLTVLDPQQPTSLLEQLGLQKFFSLLKC